MRDYVKKFFLVLSILLLTSFFALRTQAETFTWFDYDINGNIVSENRNIWVVKDYFQINDSNSETFNEQNMHYFDVDEINKITIDLDYFLSSFVYYTPYIGATIRLEVDFMTYDQLNCPKCRLALHTSDDGSVSNGMDEVAPGWTRTIQNSGEYYKFERTWTQATVPKTPYSFEFNMTEPTIKSIYGVSQPYYTPYLDYLETYYDPIELAVLDITLYVDYIMPISTQAYDIGTNYSLIPSMPERFSKVTEIEEVDEPNNIYDITFLGTQNILYKFRTEIPDAIDDEGTFTPGYLRVHKDHNYDTSLYLVYVPYQTNYMAIGGDLSEYLTDFYNYVINVSEQTYMTIGNFNVYGVVNYELERNAFAYFYLEHPIDEMLSMTLQFDYRYKTLLTGWETNWRTKYHLYENGSIQNATPQWVMMIPVLHLITNTFNLYDIEVIEELTVSDVPSKVLNKFTLSHGLSVIDLGTKDLYKVFLGKFDEVMFATSYEIQSLVIMNFTYVYVDQLISLSYPDINQEIEYLEPPLNGFEIIFDGIGTLVSGATGFISETLGMILAIGILFLVSVFVIQRINKKGQSKKYPSSYRGRSGPH